MVLIKSVIQADTLSAICPSKNTIELLDKRFSGFFWENIGDRNKYHRSSWQKICFPTEDGGVGVRRIEDIARSLYQEMVEVENSILLACLFP